MSASLFTPTADGGWLPSGWAVGPWDRGYLHGGPVAALLARGCEQAGADDPGSHRLARLTVELLRPVPRAELHLTAELTRPGRKVRLTEAVLRHAGTPVARATALFRRRADQRIPASAAEASRANEALPPPAGPQTGVAISPGAGGWPWPGFHAGGTEIRYTRGSWTGYGPCEAWIRLAVPVVAGERPSPGQRAAAAADFGNGVSKVLPLGQWRFLNPDLTVHLLRDPVGEWVCLRAQTDLGPDGGAMAESAVWDTRGRVGRSVQTLLIEAD